MARLDANLSNTQAFGNYDPLPPGDYEVSIINSEIRPAKTGEQQVVFLYEVSQGDHAGEHVFDRLSLFSSDAKTQNMAQRRLKSIAIACAHHNPNYIADTAEFHGRSMIIRTAIREYNGSLYTDIKGYLPVSGSAQAPASAPGAMPPPPPPSEVHAVKPWE